MPSPFSNMQPLANGAPRQFSAVTQAALASAGGSSDDKVGVGLLLKPSPETGYPEITGFRQGSPAELSGLLSPTGDLLCEVDGRSVHKLEAKDVTRLILGPVNSQVTLTVKRNTPDSVHRRVTLTRAPAVSGATPADQNLALQKQQQLQQEERQRAGAIIRAKELAEFLAPQVIQTGFSVHILRFMCLSGTSSGECVL
jgi:C-terminal processing protease CtpA/Prc